MDYKQILYVDTASALPTKADNGQLAFIKDTQSTSTFSTQTNSWIPLGRQMVFKSSVNVNAKNTGDTLLWTLPASPLFFYPTGIVVRAVNVSGGGTNPVMQIGTTAPYSNIATNSLVNSLLGVLDVNNGSPIMATFSPGLPGNTNIYVRVTTGALLYTNYTIKFDLLGYYDSTTP